MLGISSLLVSTRLGKYLLWSTQMARSLLRFLLCRGDNAQPGARPGIAEFVVFTRTRVQLPLRPRVCQVVASNQLKVLQHQNRWCWTR